MLVLQKTSVFTWKRRFWACFRLIELGRGAPLAHSQRRPKQRLTECTVLTGTQAEPLSLFIHTDVCLLREKGQPSSSPERKQKKANKLRQEQTEVCQTKWTRSKIKGDKQKRCLHLRSKSECGRTRSTIHAWRWGGGGSQAHVKICIWRPDACRQGRGNSKYHSRGDVSLK